MRFQVELQAKLLELTARLMAAERLPPHKVKDELEVAVGLAYCVAANTGVPDDAIAREVERLGGRGARLLSRLDA
jgi:hypothetical protein